MARINKNSTQKNTKKKKQERYNADNEIIIGVTTKPTESQTEKKKTTRANAKNKNASRKNTQYQKKQKKNKNGSNHKKISKEQEIKKITRKRFILSLSLLIVVILAGLIYFLTTPMFNITDIEVTGNEKNSAETYISLTQIQLGSTNIFAVTKGNITKNIKENAYVESVEVKRKLPNILQINITEREVAYQAKYNDQFLYIDKQGYILEMNEEKKGIIKIDGLSTVREAINVGQRLNNEDLQKLDTVLKIVNYCSYNSIENTIQTIDVADVSNYTIYFSKYRQVAYLGDASNLSERILWLKTILEKEKGNEGEIFISGNINENKVYFKAKE